MYKWLDDANKKIFREIEENRNNVSIPFTHSSCKDAYESDKNIRAELDNLVNQILANHNRIVISPNMVSKAYDYYKRIPLEFPTIVNDYGDIFGPGYNDYIDTDIKPSIWQYDRDMIKKIEHMNNYINSIDIKEISHKQADNTTITLTDLTLKPWIYQQQEQADQDLKPWTFMGSARTVSITPGKPSIMDLIRVKALRLIRLLSRVRIKIYLDCWDD